MRLLGSKEVAAEKKPLKKVVKLASPKKALEKIDEFNRKAKESEQAFLKQEEEQNARIGLLLGEVRSLEARKEKALEPLDEKAADLQIQESLLIEREEELKVREENVGLDRQENIREAQKLRIITDVMVRRGEELDIRENELDKKELLVETEAQKLAKEIDNYQAYIKNTESDLHERKLDLDRRDLELNTIHEIQAGEWDKIGKEKRVVQDLYVALEEAKKHVRS